MEGSFFRFRLHYVSFAKANEELSGNPGFSLDPELTQPLQPSDPVVTLEVFHLIKEDTIRRGEELLVRNQ